MRTTYLRSGSLPVTWLCHFWSKGPTREDIAQFPVMHAQNILPNRARDWRHFQSRDWRHFRSRHFRSWSTARSTANMAWAVSIYYFGYSVTLNLYENHLGWYILTTKVFATQANFIFWPPRSLSPRQNFIFWPPRSLPPRQNYIFWPPRSLPL
jgi:hypothetical protein